VYANTHGSGLNRDLRDLPADPPVQSERAPAIAATN
jgi:hypothetical protein